MADDRWRNEITLSGEKNLYRLNLNTGCLTTDQAIAADCNLYRGKKASARPNAPFQFQRGPRSIYEYQNEIFLKQVAGGDWRHNPSDYADGLKSLHLTLACDQALARGLVKV